MARSAACSGVNDWDEFCRRNPDLLVWKNGILARYYEESTLCNRTWPAPSSCSPTSSAESNFERGSGLSVGPGLSLKPGGAEQRSAAFLRRRTPGGRDRFPQVRNLHAGSRLILQA